VEAIHRVSREIEGEFKILISPEMEGEFRTMTGQVGMSVQIHNAFTRCERLLYIASGCILNHSIIMVHF